MAATFEGFMKYLRPMPDADKEDIKICFEAALADIHGAGVPEYKNNRLYDIFVYALAGHYYDNRNLQPIGASTEETQKMINSFVLKLRFAKDGQGQAEEGNKNG